jgi:hypothetical protein
VGVDFEQRGIHIQPSIEYHTQISAGWDGPLSFGSHDLELSLTAAVDLVTNSNYIEGADETNGYVRLGVRGEI